MLNLDLQVKKDLFDPEKAELVSIRDGFGKGLVSAGEKNKNVVALCADLKESTRVQEFAEKFPDRFFEVGVAEQNMAAIAAGLGISGKTAFISSYAVFSPGRNWEQIRTTVAYNDSDVKIAGHHAGVSTGPDGATHQALEDIAIMRTMPNMRVIVPCDAYEAEKATLAAAENYGPVYLRLARDASPIITSKETPFEIGKAHIFWRSEKPQVALIACGPILYQALLAAREAEKDGIGVLVINSPSVKPLDEKTIIEAAKKCGAIVSIEEHQIAGGLGGAIAECLAKNVPVPQEFIGMNDSFGESGFPEELLRQCGMSAMAIIAAIKKVVKRKN